jgi:hypothetical protein
MPRYIKEQEPVGSHKTEIMQGLTDSLIRIRKILYDAETGSLRRADGSASSLPDVATYLLGIVSEALGHLRALALLEAEAAKMKKDAVEGQIKRVDEALREIEQQEKQDGGKAP